MAQSIAVGMSGGVDSSLTAALLLEAGHELLGLSMRLSDGPGVADGLAAAAATAKTLGIPHRVVDLRQDFRERVLDPFRAALRQARTPNPCAVCNPALKFGVLLEVARAAGAEVLATGHYARICHQGDRMLPGVAADHGKDQSYFLFALSQQQLAAARFPLGNLHKDVVRAQAAARGLVAAERPDSQDLCWVGAGGLSAWLELVGEKPFPSGDIVHVDGCCLGRHRGLHHYTIGQRKGLGIGWHEPLYVVGRDPRNNVLVVGPRSALWCDRALLGDCVWHLGELPAEGLSCCMRNRHGALPVPALLLPRDDGQVEVRYRRSVPRPAPGQAGVAYDAELSCCLGGGWFVSEDPGPDTARL